MKNNIFYPHSGSEYNTGTGDSTFGAIGAGMITNNLWFNGVRPPNPATTFSPNSQSTNPAFANSSTTAPDFHSQTGSPSIDSGTAAVSTVVLDDFDVATATRVQTLRPVGAGYDIGPYER